MLKAKNIFNNELVISWLDKIYPTDEFICPSCLGEVIFVDADFKIKHFRHKVESNCEPEPETKEHLEMKKFMMEKLGWDKNNLEVSLGYARPDLFKDNIAIEVQHSYISYYDFLERTTNYTNHGVYVLWIFDRCILNELISESIKKAHELYFGRIYIFDNGIFPVHAQSTKTYVEEYDKLIWQDDYSGEPQYETFGGYWRYNKKKKEYIYGDEIKNYYIIQTENTWKNNNFKIARFTDKKFWGDTYDEDKIC